MPIERARTGPKQGLYTKAHSIGPLLGVGMRSHLVEIASPNGSFAAGRTQQFTEGCPLRPRLCCARCRGGRSRFGVTGMRVGKPLFVPIALLALQISIAPVSAQDHARIE